MNSEVFEVGDWIDRLGQALSRQAEEHESRLRKYYGLEPDVQIMFGGREGDPRTLPPEGVRDHFTLPGRRWNWVTREAERHAPKDLAPDDARNILLSHPAWAAIAGSMLGDDEFWVQVLDTGRPTSLKDLIAGLMARASELPDDRFRTAAAEFCALLTPIGGTSAAGVPDGPDVGYEAVLFYGLTLKERIDVADGMAIVPFEQVKAFVDESLVEKLPPAGAEAHGWRSVGAMVRPFRWKPVFRRTGDLGDSGLKPPGSFFRDARTFLELLSVAHAAPVLRFAELSNCTDRGAGRLLGLERRGPGFFQSWTADGFDGLADRPRLAREALAEAREAFENRTSGQYEAMAPIVGRLAEALARGGRFAGDDMILDVAIALERMYQLEGGEITHKMRTRVAWYLGTDAASRLRYMKGAKEVYDVRSKIVHPAKKEMSAERRREAFTKGFDIARRTLFKLLREGAPGNWDELVVAGTAP